MVEPFSFTNMYETIPYMYGYSGYPWRTGTAGWFAVAVVEWILGARRHYDGLLIDPVLDEAGGESVGQANLQGSGVRDSPGQHGGSVQGRAIDGDGWRGSAGGGASAEERGRSSGAGHDLEGVALPTDLHGQAQPHAER